jgi:hypothetical protein
LGKKIRQKFYFTKKLKKKKKKKKTDWKYIVIIVRIGEAQVNPSVIRLEMFSILDST